MVFFLLLTHSSTVNNEKWNAIIDTMWKGQFGKLLLYFIRVLT